MLSKTLVDSKSARSLVDRARITVLMLILACLSPTLSWNNGELRVSLPEAHADSISYAYDAIGRVIQATNATTGQVVVYSYDPAGNITAQQVLALSTLSFTDFSPSQGSPGSSVSIAGTGFSTTLSANAVTINGVAATVTSATQSQLVVTVPAGATSGPIAVTVGSTTVTSSRSFSVVQGPTISGFSPAMVDQGASVTVTGNNFSAVAGMTKLFVGTSQVQTTSLSSTQAVFTVPSTAGSGPIQVSTLYGQATSATDLIVIPSGIGLSNVISFAALTANGASASLNVGQTGKYGAFTFSATAGQWLSVAINSLTTSPAAASINYQVYSPSSASILSGTISATNTLINLPVIPKSGDYLITFTSSSATFQLTAQLASNALAAMDGAPLTVTTTLATQLKRFTFVGNPGENIGLGISNLVLTPTTNAIINVYKPDGALLQTANCSPANGGCDFNLFSLPMPGTYAVLIQPNGQATTSLTATVSHDLVVPLTANVVSSANMRNGQNARFTFSGSASSSLALKVGGPASTPAGRVMSYTVYKPDGTVLSSYSIASGLAFDLVNLPVTGTYSLLVDPQYGAATTISAMMVPSASAAVTVDGASSSLSNAAIPGASNYFTFSATAGENVGVGISNMIVTNNVNAYVGVYVYKPDGTALGSMISCTYSTGCDLNLVNLPATGEYSLVVQSPTLSNEPNLQLSFTATISHDLVVPLTANTVSTATLRNGQNGRFTFSGTAGSGLGLQIGGPTSTPAGRVMNYTVYKPDGTVLSSYSIASGLTFTWPSLPVTGTYTLLVDPQYGAATTIKVMPVPSSSATVATDGASTTVSNTSIPGAANYFTFSATAGDNIGIGISNMVPVNNTNGYAIIYLYRPDGSMLVNAQQCYYSSGCDINLPNVSQTGVYGVVVQAPTLPNESNLQLSFTATVSRDLVVPLTANTVATATLRNGQNGRFTFAGTAGTAHGLQIGGPNSTPAGRVMNYTVYKPDGTVLSSYSIASGLTFTWPSLPTTGTYTLLVDPQYGAATTIKVMPVPSPSVAVTVDGASSAVSNTSIPGAANYFTFSATAGDNIGIGISNMVPVGNTNNYVIIYLYRPDGSMLVNAQQCSYSTGCDINLPNVSQTGTYSVVLQAPTLPNESNLQVSFTATISRDLVVPMTANVVSTGVLRNGQNGRFTFSGTAGVGMALQVGGPASTPAGRVMNYTVYKPDGTVLTPYSIASGLTFTWPSLPVTGTYTLLVDPQYGAATTIKVMPVPYGTAAVAVDGASSAISNASIPGAPNHFTFSATIGENIGIGISNLVPVNNINSYVSVYVYKPDGTMLVNALQCTYANNGCDINLANIPATGVYSVVMQSPTLTTEPNLQIGFTATVSHDLIVPLTANVVSTGTLRNGQNGRFTFSGTAGIGLALQVGGPASTPAGRVMNYTVYKPDGTVLTPYSIASGLTFVWPSLPTTGTYTLLVDPQYGAATTIKVMSVPYGTAAVAIDGASRAISNASIPGAPNQFTFSGTAGDNISIGISNLVPVNNINSYVSIYVYKPDGSMLVNGQQCVYANNGCDINLTNLSATGVYSVVMQSPTLTTEPNLQINFTATASHDLVVALVTGTAINPSLRSGQNGRFTFAATAGSGGTMQISGITTTPAGGLVGLSILKPDGSTLGTTSNASGHTFNLTGMPVTGTYTLYVDPQYGASATMQIVRN